MQRPVLPCPSRAKMPNNSVGPVPPAGLRQRRVLVLGDPQALRNRGAAGGGAAAGAGAAAAAAPAAPAAGGAARRPRVFTIRINMRALLQVLVFGVVLYQVGRGRGGAVPGGQGQGWG